MHIATMTAFEEELVALRKTGSVNDVMGSVAKWYASASPVTKAMVGFAALGAAMNGLKGAQDTDPVYNPRTGNIQNPNLVDRFNRTASGAARGAVGGAAGAALTGFLLGKFKKASTKEAQLPGGMADRKGTTFTDFPKSKLDQGEQVEHEHTSDKWLARTIALDHLTEDPKYYKKLKKVERG